MDQFLVAPVDLGSELADLAVFQARRDPLDEQAAGPGAVVGRIDADHVQYGDAGVVAGISELKDEPAWMRDFRLKAYNHWLARPMPTGFWSSKLISEKNKGSLSPESANPTGPRI